MGNTYSFPNTPEVCAMRGTKLQARRKRSKVQEREDLQAIREARYNHLEVRSADQYEVQS